jgi:threonine/homoserine/homoserine lactone efflux protein
MTIQLLLAFITFAFVMSVTPGPNNMMLLASGVNFGLRRSLPHLLGISLGLMLMVCAMGFGLGQLLKLYPPLFNILRYVGGAYCCT